MRVANKGQRWRERLLITSIVTYQLVHHGPPQLQSTLSSTRHRWMSQGVGSNPCNPVSSLLLKISVLRGTALTNTCTNLNLHHGASLTYAFPFPLPSSLIQFGQRRNFKIQSIQFHGEWRKGRRSISLDKIYLNSSYSISDFWSTHLNEREHQIPNFRTKMSCVDCWLLDNRKYVSALYIRAVPQPPTTPDLFPTVLVQI